ncbi:MAG: thermonuclease family protein [Sphingomicrobium sp.]
MSKHWPPDDSFRTRSASAPSALPVVIGAVLVGLTAGMMLGWSGRNAGDVGAASGIEWNAVQAVPTRTPDPEDVAWEQRARAFDGAGSAPSAAGDAEGMRASFGYCYAGGGSNCVVDGDTFWIRGEKVRIAGIDAPETHPSRCASEARLGNAATQRLHALLNSGAVTMTAIDRDRDVYGRLLRNVAVNGADVGEAMVGAGVARDYAGGRRPWC